MKPETNNAEDVTIKLLQPTPPVLESLSALINTCYRSTQNWTNESRIVSGSRTTPSQLLRESRSHEIYTAYHGKDLIGCIKTGRVESTVIGKLTSPAGYIGLLAVDSGYQSRGIGTRLIQFAEKRCAELGLGVMVMDVLSPRVDIIEWYVRLGYTPTGDSADALGVISAKGETLLTPASFLVLEKHL